MERRGRGEEGEGERRGRGRGGGGDHAHIGLQYIQEKLRQVCMFLGPHGNGRRLYGIQRCLNQVQGHCDTRTTCMLQDLFYKGKVVFLWGEKATLMKCHTWRKFEFHECLQHNTVGEVALYDSLGSTRAAKKMHRRGLQLEKKRGRETGHRIHTKPFGPCC